MKLHYKILFYFVLFISEIFLSCASTNKDITRKEPNIKFNKIDNYSIEISGLKNIKNIYFYRVPTGLSLLSAQFKGEDYKRTKDFQDFIDETISNISITINGIEYYLKFANYETFGLYSFYLSDTNGRKLFITDTNKIILQSKCALTYFNGIAETKLEFNKKQYGRKKYPYDCLIYLDGLQIAKNTKKEQEQTNLARTIIVKKYGFLNSYEYTHWLNRCNWHNLYTSLSAGTYSNSIPFEEGDIITMKGHLLTIENIDYTDNGYLYLITAAKNQLSKCCMIISQHQLSYMNYNNTAMITEPLMLKFEGKNQYQQGYSFRPCDVFKVIEPNSKEYFDYITKINDIKNIEENPYAYKNILDE